jgi:hypothetical protein
VQINNNISTVGHHHQSSQHSANAALMDPMQFVAAVTAAAQIQMKQQSKRPSSEDNAQL